MTENEKWNAVMGSDADMDGLFYYAVKSTGIFCRPSCKSKEPLRENALFFDSREDALAAGFRPCKRCRPDLDDYQPLADIASRAKNTIEANYSQKQSLADELNNLEISKRRLDQVFKQRYGVSPGQYANGLRIRAATERLERSAAPVIDIAYSLGFESLSAFFAFFRKHTGMTPGEYRRRKSAPSLWESASRSVYDTAFGRVAIACDDSAVVAVQFADGLPFGIGERRGPLADRTALALEDYFSGKRTAFDIPLAPQGTRFQTDVWDALRQIPYGETRTYGEVAKAIGNPGASRAVGMANNKNPILILIPCHRVIGSNGSLTGYAGGLELKQSLLQLERDSGYAAQ